jgi:hypothetical protein
MLTVTAPSAKVEVNCATARLLSVTYACALLTVYPVNPILTFCAPLPVFVNTTATELSKFLNAPYPTPLTVPEDDTRYAPGLINLDHIANAQSLPDGVTTFPSLATKYEDAWNWLTSKPCQ